MIAESFVFDTSKIKDNLGWQPTLTNGEMLFEALDYYRRHSKDIGGSADVAAHKQQRPRWVSSGSSSSFHERDSPASPGVGRDRRNAFVVIALTQREPGAR